MMEELNLLSNSEEETRRMGRCLGRALTAGAVVLLEGELGTGKTVLVRGVGEELGASGVRSPSFTLVNEYRTPGLMLVHADLYRMEAGAEGLGLEEYALLPDAALLVEWPDRWASAPWEDALKVTIQSLDEGRRRLVFRGAGSAEALLSRFLAHWGGEKGV